ncbi:MAG: GNAT family N-acetyltransferase [Candidatus Aminicenantes bacterium]|nr:GNAT family N-acetyltransferase [Candidatus Aminicenantes bacterium]
MKENFIGLSIEPFRGDLEQLETMAHQAWREEYGQASFPNLYRPDFVRFLMSTIPDRNHFLAAYKNGELLAFLANLPRTINYRGKHFRAILSCLLVSRKEYARQGLATALIREAVKINQEKAGYDLALLYLEKGHKSSKLIMKLKEEGENLQFLRNMFVLGRVLNLERVARSEGLKSWEKLAIKLLRAHRLPADKNPEEFEIWPLRPEEGTISQLVLKWLNRYQGRVDLARFWQGENELIRELIVPEVSETVWLSKKGQPVAMFNYFLHYHIGQTVERWAWVNHVAFEGLTETQQVRAVNYFLCYLAEKDVVGVVEWNRKYYPTKILYRAHFFPYFRSVNLYAWVFNPEHQLRPIKSVYEVQI